MIQEPMDMFYILLSITIVIGIGIVIYYVKKHTKIRAIYKKYNVKTKEELLDKCGLKTMAEIVRYYWDSEHCRYNATLAFTPVDSASSIFVLYYFDHYIPTSGNKKQPVEERYPTGSSVEIEYCPDYPKIYRTVTELSNKPD